MEFKSIDEQKKIKADDGAKPVNEETTKEVKLHYNQAWEIEIDEFEPPFPI